MKKKTVFKGIINYKLKSSHPDIQCVKNPDDEIQFEDTYTFDSDNFDYNEEEMIHFIKNDLALVAGGGYSKEHIKDVKFDIRKV